MTLLQQSRIALLAAFCALTSPCKDKRDLARGKLRLQVITGAGCHLQALADSGVEPAFRARLLLPAGGILPPAHLPSCFTLSLCQPAVLLACRSHTSVLQRDLFTMLEQLIAAPSAASKETTTLLVRELAVLFFLLHASKVLFFLLHASKA